MLPQELTHHLAVLLGLYATVAEREHDEPDGTRRPRWRRVRHALLWEHLLSWLGPYLARVEDLGSPVYAAWAASLRGALAEEAAALGGPVALPLHLREAPPLPAAEAGADEWLEALVAPARSGVLLTRADLARGARELGLGLRAGERRFALRALVGQDPRATLAWLAGEARAWESRHVGAIVAGPAIGEWWASRARATAAALEDARVEENVHA